MPTPTCRIQRGTLPLPCIEDGMQCRQVLCGSRQCAQVLWHTPLYASVKMHVFRMFNGTAAGEQHPCCQIKTKNQTFDIPYLIQTSLMLR